MENLMLEIAASFVKPRFLGLIGMELVFRRKIQTRRDGYRLLIIPREVAEGLKTDNILLKVLNDHLEIWPGIKGGNVAAITRR
jgi:hypothetical protein